MDDQNNSQIKKRREMRRGLKFMSWVASAGGVFGLMAGATLYMSFQSRLTNLEQSSDITKAYLASAAKYLLFSLTMCSAIPLLLGIYTLRYLHSEPQPNTHV